MDDRTQPDAALKMDTPVACVIRVQGTIAPEVMARLCGLRLVAAGGDPAWSELQGELRDQAALYQVLTVLHQLVLPLLRVTCAPPGRGPIPDGSRTP